MLNVEHVPLYTPEQLSKFKEDKIFDVKFIQDMMGYVGSETPGYVATFIGYNSRREEGEEYEKYVSPLIFSEVFTTNWWRFNSPKRFCNVIDHDVSVYDLFPKDCLENYQEKITLAQKSVCENLFRIVSSIKVPVFTKSVAIDALTIARLTITDKENNYSNENRMASNMMVELIKSVVKRQFNCNTNNYIDYSLQENLYGRLANKTIARNAKIAYSSVCGDLLRKMFPTISEASFEYTSKRCYWSKELLDENPSLRYTQRCIENAMDLTTYLIGSFRYNPIINLNNKVEYPSDIVCELPDVDWTKDLVKYVNKLNSEYELYTDFGFTDSEGIVLRANKNYR